MSPPVTDHPLSAAARSGLRPAARCFLSVSGFCIHFTIARLSPPPGSAILSYVDLTTVDPATGARIIRSPETNLGDLCADAYRSVLGADVALVNGGGIRARPFPA